MLSAFDQVNDNPDTSVQPSWLAQDVIPPSPLLLHVMLSAQSLLRIALAADNLHLTTT